MKRVSSFRHLCALASLAATLLSSLVLSLLAASLAQAAAPAVPLPAMKTGQLSVSGLSSGGYMAVQFAVAYSASVTGAGIIAAGPYSCSRGNLGMATMRCSCTSGTPWCGVAPGGTNVPELIRLTGSYAARGRIDPTSNLARHRVWLFSGLADSVVPMAVMNDLQAYYRHYLPPENIRYRKDVRAQHAMPTESFGNRCDQLGAPYISDCDVDGAGELLQWIYGTLIPKAGHGAAGRLVEFDQAEFLADPAAHGMAATGWLYVPPGCERDGAGCRLHVAFHGCKQTSALVKEAWVRHAGYNPWADANRIVMLYPQAAPLRFRNPNACWDWFNYDDPDFAVKSGRQMRAVKRMTERLMTAERHAGGHN
ncbi:PHA-depolymerase-like protein [Pseudoduganella sp. SL102]|uniref:extracellular catalytic domain type 2 short-chain-length polyhydroxyalkanoate depolymerase n=1 Tax=Pseudoduganella sp. SL102 TaxID=2995154 RepID=UPI00248BC848|nr:PHB depolymerase family esterase [Pseudoduganella sp. SL102]WBS03135.1 PHA-depolymerase-like protein [Pseudoduganella sp. SL102]